MSNIYAPQDMESKWYKHWEEKGYFHSEPDRREPYTIVIPPPNVTGALHLGHALNNTIQDVLIRYHRMNGKNACWIPGTDHAGIATQSVVEKQIFKQEKKTRHDIGRDSLLERIWKWKETYGNRIIDQLKKLGCSCDWKRTCFTMDEHLSHAVRFVFLELFKEGLIYRGKRLINWCPGCRTALSDDELKYEEVKTHFWQIRYPIVGTDDFITVATTRPETMLGDTAVAVHSQDPRYQKYIGKKCLLPLMRREIPIVADDILADPTKGTGAVKVTPAHDPNDYACALRNHLPMINILKEDGRLNENAGQFAGLDILTARKQVLEALKAEALLGNIEELTHAVAHCYRSDDVVEPYLSDQWFVKMAPLVELARKSVTSGEVSFFPERRTEDYLRWLDHTPDWCISRQIWWGHRIPIWYCRDCHPEIQLSPKGEPMAIPSHAKPILPMDDKPETVPHACPECKGKNLVQDGDVLDTWFSSQLWPLSTLGWPNKTKDLAYYYPTSVLVTGRDIIALWVARMVMMGEKFMHKKPFSHVFINGTIQDEHGDIMSKSRGNGFDPVKAIEGGKDQIEAAKPFGTIPAKRIEYYPTYGCDALRFGLISAASGQDSRILIDRTLRPEKTGDLPEYDVAIPIFEEGKRFCNKIWQASHGVVFRNCENITLSREIGGALEDQWLSHKMHKLIEECREAVANYRLAEMCSMLYHFFWDDLCSWYLEIVKPRLWGEHGEESKRQAQSLLTRTLDSFLKMMHPIMPFLTEDLWQNLQSLIAEGSRSKEKACLLAQWPTLEEYPCYEEASLVVEMAREITSAINNIRAEQKLKPADKIPQAFFTGTNAKILEALQIVFPGISKLTKVEKIQAAVNLEKPQHTAVRIVKDVEIYIPLEGLIDFGKEKEKIQKDKEKLSEQITKLEQKLANSEYTGKAPAHVIDRDRARLEEWKNQHRKLVELQATMP